MIIVEDFSENMVENIHSTGGNSFGSHEGMVEQSWSDELESMGLRLMTFSMRAILYSKSIILFGWEKRVELAFSFKPLNIFFSSYMDLSTGLQNWWPVGTTISSIFYMDRPLVSS